MPITYTSQAKQTLMQPFFRRFRQTYRGHRISVNENRESNFFHIDVSILNSLLLKIDKDIDRIADIFVGDLNNLSELNKLNDGLFHDLGPIKVYYKQRSDLNVSVEENLVLSKTNRLSALLSRIDRKVTRLESERK